MIDNTAFLDLVQEICILSIYVLGIWLKTDEAIKVRVEDLAISIVDRAELHHEVGVIIVMLKE